MKSLDSETARDYFERYYELVFDDDRDIMTCELNDDDDMNWLLSSLDSIRMDEGWLLDNTGCVSMDLYVRPVGTKRPPVGPCDISYHLNEHYRPYVIPEEDIISPFEHIRLPFTRKALWQIYLLYSSTDILGKFGHGRYNLKKFVFEEDVDLNKTRDSEITETWGVNDEGKQELLSKVVHEVKGSDFSGTLHLPTSLKTSCPLGFPKMTGDIIIPQGFTYCPDFSNGGYDGHVEIPEGVTVVSGFARTNIRGEVRIPSTATKISEMAFAGTKISNVILHDDITDISDAYGENMAIWNRVWEYLNNNEELD